MVSLPKENLEGKFEKKFHSVMFRYYADLGVCTPSDDYFAQMIESAWGICENEDDETYKANIGIYVSSLRSQLQSLFCNNMLDAGVIHKVFNDFDLNQNGNITIDELASMIAKCQIACERKYLRGILRCIGISGNGTISLDEFTSFVMGEH